MLDPWKLLGRLSVAAFRIAGYGLVFLMQAMVYLSTGKPEKVADAFGGLGRGVIDALTDTVRS